MSEPDGFAGSQVAIVGLGLMGGSLALALRGRCARLLGIDPDPATLALARQRKIVDEASGDPAELLPQADFIILAAPVRAIINWLGNLPALHPGPATVLDIGSSKSQVTRAMEALPERFDPLGGHPMCGKETSGLAQAEAGLFRGKVFILTPLVRTTPAALALGCALAVALEARPLIVAAQKHDALVAYASHLPYLLAATLVSTAQSQGDPQVWELAASGFRDTSRLAASDVTMMVDVLLTNRAAILEALAGCRLELENLTQMIDRGDETGLRDVLGAAQRQRLGMFK